MKSSEGQPSCHNYALESIYDRLTTFWSITASPGTILNFSSWRASVGSNTVAVVSGGITRWTVDKRWVGIGVTLCAGMTGGAWLALA